MEVSLNAAALSDYLSKHNENNHLYVLENMFREMLQIYALKKCELSATLTNYGNISLVLEALNPGNHELCQNALVKMANSIENNKSFPMHPTFKVAAFFEGYVRNKLLDVQYDLMAIPGEVKDMAHHKLGEEVYDFNQRIEDLPDTGYKTLTSDYCKVIIILTLFTIL